MNFDTLLDRFEACNTELVTSTALEQAYRLPPTADHKQVDLPMIYCLPASFEVQGVDAGSDNDTDTVIMHILIQPLESDKYDTEGLSESIASAATLADAVRTYYRNHRKLHTTSPALGNLAGLWRGVDFSGRIVVGLVGYDGGRYYGVELTFRIYSTASVAQNY